MQSKATNTEEIAFNSEATTEQPLFNLEEYLKYVNEIDDPKTIQSHTPTEEAPFNLEEYLKYVEKIDGNKTIQYHAQGPDGEMQVCVVSEKETLRAMAMLVAFTESQSNK